MTVETIVGTPANIKGDFTVSSGVLGTTDVSVIVGAGQVGLIIDAAVNLRTLNIDTMVERLRDAFREQVTKLS